MYSRFLLLTIFTLMTTAVYAQDSTLDYSKFRLVFEENFNDLSKEDLSARWQFVHDDPNFGWGDTYDSSSAQMLHGEYYHPAMVKLKRNGTLRLKTRRMYSSDSLYSQWTRNFRKPQYRSGMIQLRLDLKDSSRFDIKNGQSGYIYGLFEIAVKLPANPQNFAAFWLTRAGLPTEIDVFEFGEVPGLLTNNVHDFALGRSKQSLLPQPNPKSFTKKFQIISAYWTKDFVAFYLNGQLISTVYAHEVATYDTGVLSLIVNLGMKPYFNVTRNQMDVDFIRVYKLR